MSLIKSLKATVDGLLTVFKHLFKRPVTLEYPEKKVELNDKFRGKIKVKGCIGCGICVKVCPSGAICFEKDASGKVHSYKVDLKKCIFCGNCKFYCPVKAISMTKEYELATADKTNLVLSYMNKNKISSEDINDK